jgi:hypothetical protein
MVNFFGNKNALIGSLDLLFGAIYVLGAFIFRKSIANDQLDMGFSAIGASAASCIIFVVIKAATEVSLKVNFVIGLIAWVIGGFLLSEVIGDGWADGSNRGD